MSNAAARKQYAQDGMGTASNDRLVVMLYDRLDRDFVEAGSEMALGNRQGAHDAVMHGQEIIYELIGALDVESWDGAAGLQELYVYCLNEMTASNMTQDTARLENTRQLLRSLGDAWRETLTGSTVATSASSDPRA